MRHIKGRVHTEPHG